MTLQTELSKLKEQYTILGTIDLDEWHDDYAYCRDKFKKVLGKLHKEQYQNNERIVFTHTSDYYDENIPGVKLRTIQELLNQIDISNFFVVILSTNPNLPAELDIIQQTSSDSVKLSGTVVAGEFVKNNVSTVKTYSYSSTDPIKIGIDELSPRERFLLAESKTFCMLPWIHLHAFPTGEAYPCCFAEMGPGQVGNCKTNTLKEIWNSDQQKKLRVDMLNETPNAACTRCYEQEQHGAFSGRRSANKHHGHNVARVAQTHPDGQFDQFELTYWDIRFSNLCNLKCRSCGHIFSSQWHQDQKKLVMENYWNNVRGDNWPSAPPKNEEELQVMPEFVRNDLMNVHGGEIVRHLKYVKELPALQIAGRSETDMWEQLIPHLDYVEQIYFAGGEPLLMEEHYNILEELLKRGRTEVRLIYNTNFTHTDLKGRSVFEYWKQFKSVAVGASLDDSGARGEYIRKGTDWAVVEQNRRDMLSICPEVDFYISPTLSIMNAKHLPQFHREWVAEGLIKPKDLNVNTLLDPAHYRIDIATPEYKEELSTIYLNHIMWLREVGDPLGRATQGFESAIKFMNATDNSHLIPKFWAKTLQLDEIRKEKLLDVIPELGVLR